MDQGQPGRGGDAGEEPEPGRAGDRGGGGGGEGGPQHLAFEADVDDAGALGEEPGQRRQHQRRRHPQGRRCHGDGDEEGVFHASGLRRQRPGEQALQLRAEQVLERAAEQDHQALMTTTISLLSAGMEKASSDPP